MTPANHPTEELNYEITDPKLYVSVVTLSKGNDTKPLEQLKSRFKKVIK